MDRRLLNDVLLAVVVALLVSYLYSCSTLSPRNGIYCGWESIGTQWQSCECAEYDFESRTRSEPWEDEWSKCPSGLAPGAQVL